MRLLAKRIGLLLAFLCLVSGTPLAFRELWDYRQIVSNLGTAPITKIEAKRWGKRRRLSLYDRYHYRASYEFADEYGVTWRGKQTIDRDLYNFLTDSVPDTKLRISYARHDPAKNAIDLNAMRKSSAVLPLIVLVVWAVVIGMYLLHRREEREGVIRARRALEIDRAIRESAPVQTNAHLGRWRRRTGRHA